MKKFQVNPRSKLSLLKTRSQQIFIAVCMAGLLSGISIAGFAQTEPPPAFQTLSMSAFPPYEGNFKYGEWLPVRVELTNEGADLQAEVRAEVQGSGGTMVFSLPVELAAGAHKQITLYVLPNNFTRQINIELVSGGKLIASQKIDVHPNPTINFLVGIISPERGALNLINTIEITGVKRTLNLVDIPLAELPERAEGIRSFDILIVTDTDTTSLTPAQVSAIESWVRQGGRLVIGGGSNAQLTAAGFPDSLFPGKINNTLEVDDLTSLEDFLDPERPVLVPGPFVVAELIPEGGQTLAGDDQKSFIHEWTLTKGTVTFISLDPSKSPFDAWNGTTPFWQKLIGEEAVFPDGLPTDISARQQFASNMPYVLTNLPILDLPSAKGLSFMLVLYIILVGPVNYLFLRYKKRLHLAWITIPAITVFFSLASFGLGYALHGTDIFINKISVIQVNPSGDAHFDSFIGVFSPAQTNYRVEVIGGGLLSPLTPYYEPWSSVSPQSSTSSGRIMTLVQGDPAFVEGLSVDQWSMQSFMSEGSISQFGGIQSDLRLVDDKISGSVTNTSSQSYQDAFIIMGGKFARVGALAPQASFDVEIDMSGLGSPSMGASLSYSIFEKDLNDTGSSSNRRRAEAKRSIVENIFERTPPLLSSSSSAKPTAASAMVPVFVGWLDQGPPEVRIIGSETASQTTSVVLESLDYTLPIEGKISLPAGMIPGRLAIFPRDGGTCGAPGTTGVYIPQGEAYFEFFVPEKLMAATIERLKLGIWTDSGVFGEPTIEVYDWTAENWIKLSGITQGINLLPSEPDIIRSNGQVNIRLSVVSGSSCYYLSLGLEGTAN